MYVSKEETTSAISTSLEMMLSRSYSSRDDFVRDYKKLCCENSKAEEFYLLVLIELEKTISEDDIESFKKLSTLIAYTSDLESRETLREYYDNTDNPIRRTNLVILASKHNRIEILRYLLDSDSELLNNLSVGIGRDSISPKDEDEVHHNAFYYAIRSENIQLLDSLITNKYFNNYFAVHFQELEEILSKTYDELQLKNVPLSDEIQYFVERKLIEQRFFSTGQQPISNITEDVCTKTEKRLELLLQRIALLKVEYANSKKVDGKFLYVARCIAQSIHILKGRLRSSYDRIPWEEMEFCLVVFVSSQTRIEELNLFYRTILNKDKILNCMEHFANSIRDDEDITKGGDRKTREVNVKNIIKTYPQFKELYNDYHEIRDIYSLKRIDDHIKLALLADAKDKQGQLVIIRVLQVIGEHLKTTLESPKLSHNTSQRLVLSLSQNARKLIIRLRDSISHAHSLSIIMEIEENADVSFFINVQSDIRKVGDVITDIFYKNRLQTITMLLKQIVESETSDAIKGVLEELGAAQFDITIFRENFKTLKHEKLEKLIKELSSNIADKTNYENELFNKINVIINRSEDPTKNIEFDYLLGYVRLQNYNLELSYNNYTDKNLIKIIKDCANDVLNHINKNTKSNGFEEIVKLSRKIFRCAELRIQNDKFQEAQRLTMEIISIVEFETGEINWIEELNKKLKKKKINLGEDKYNKQLQQKVHELSSVLSKSSLSEFRRNKTLQYVVKMFVLDIMSILGSPEHYKMENNTLFLEDNAPLLYGSSLRNYLAHDNALVDVGLPDPLIAVILNAKKLTEENIMKGKKKIGKLVSDDLFKLRKKFDQDLDTITTQEKMFVALEEGNLDGLKDCIKKGADIKARSLLNSWTTLHFAAKGPSLEVVKFLLDENLNVNVKDNSGDTPLHIAAAHGRQDFVNLFFKETDVCVDVQNINGKTPLHVAAQYGHKDIVEVLLQNKAIIHTRDASDSPPWYYAIRNNRIDVAKILLKNNVNLYIEETWNELTALHVAATFGQLESVNFLLESGANIEAKTDTDQTPLHLATAHGYLEVTNSLIHQGANVNAQTTKGYMPLHYAIHNGNLKMVNSLLTLGAKVNTATITPLHIAAKHGHLQIVTALLKRGANINAKSDYIDTPVNQAARNGHKEVVELLIENGAQINPTESANFTALHAAVKNGHKDVAQLLIRNNAAVNAQFTGGITATHLAARKGFKDVIDLLIKNDAEVNARSSNGMTPLHFAVTEDHEAAVEFLIKNKADVNAKNNNSFTPLHLAVVQRNINIVKLLIDHNAQVNLRGIGDRTPLHVAAENGHKDIVEILVAKGANINDKNYIRTPLHCAIKCNHKEIVEFLIDKGANVNAEDVDTWSLPLIAGYTDIVETLLKHKAYDVNYKDSDHLTPLHIAAIGGHEKLVKTLITNGADVHAASINNKTPLLCAAQSGFERVVEVLLAHGAKINLKSNQGSTPLCEAAKGGHSKVVKVLLDNKVNLNINDTTNNAPVPLAVAGGHLEVVKIFFEYKKVHIDYKSEDGFTLLHIASQGTNLELVKYLVEEGFDIRATTSSGYKAIHVAARSGFKEGVEFFIDIGLSVNELGAHNETLLHCAVMKSHLKIVDYLIAQRADVNVKESANGFTPMHYAAMNGCKAIVEVLLKNGAIYDSVDRLHRKPLELANNKDVSELLQSTEKLFKAVKKNSSSEVQNCITAGAFVNAVNTEGITPLYCPARKGYDEIVRVLLQNKANPNVVDNKGLTPLHYAAKFSHLKVAEALLSYYAVYNAVSDDGKTPLDLTVDKSIINLFKLVTGVFKYIEDNNPRVINTLSKIKDINTVKAVMCACNSKNRTLVVAAMHSNFSEVQQLKEIAQSLLSALELESAIIECFRLENNEKALSMIKNVYKERKKILGSHNPGILDIKKDFADVLREQGDYQQSLDVFEEIFQEEKEMLGLYHQDTLMTRSLIAFVKHSQRKNEEAINIYREVYPIQKEMLGPHHEDTLMTQGNMALVLSCQGKYKEALKIFRSQYSFYLQNTKPESYLNTLNAQSNIAMVLALQDNHEESLTIYNEVLQKMTMVLGANHYDTLGALQNIGDVFLKQQKYDKSLEVFKDVLKRRKQVLKPNHPDILMTQFNIGNSLFFQLKWIGALKAYREGFDQMKEVLGSNHPHVLLVLENIQMINVLLKVQGNNPLEMLQHLMESINIAAHKGDIPTIHELLESGADANDKDDDGLTPLYFAIDNEHVNVVNMLLNHGADVTQVTNKGNTPLHKASLKGSDEIVEILLRHVSSNTLNCFINAKTTGGGTAALHVAAKNGFVNIAISLLKRGAVYNITNNDGKTPLDLCKYEKITNLFKLIDELFQYAKSGNVKIIQKLHVVKPEEFVAVINARDDQNYTLLQVAIANKHKNVASKLSEMFKD